MIPSQEEVRKYEKIIDSRFNGNFIELSTYRMQQRKQRIANKTGSDS